MMKKAVDKNIKKMSPGEFRQYIISHPVGQISFDAADQDWFDPFGVHPGFHCSFTSIGVDLTPALITLGDRRRYVRLHGIDYIQVDTEQGKIFVHCTALLPDCAEQKRTYTFSTDPEQVLPID